ncbi:efflux RND transporter periplasmic adaptor subunit [Aliidiomarina iranensis]|uniref:Efflux RND transporter periplasmic adaptor subunit n=1 Tax=Aliidiomarina iranensis TaxID=1434071 RepID=A0A432VQK7_9GAMM|nr:efflux RND transporter periplasmic adaptor subunit [Aliidiomarina iranensis]RUO18488.1 efflux RND transporter periplasmic adaptor subunit [Aliidiomarina iranensis]
MNTAKIRIFALLLALPVALFGCGNPSTANSVESEPKETERGVPVEVQKVARGTVRASIQASAILEAEEETDVIARVSGIVEEILVEEGDFVEQGQALVRLESSRYRYSRDQIAAELRGVTQELTRMRQLAGQQMVSTEQVERLQSRHDALSAQLQIAELDLAEAVIRAPISGHIAERFVKTGNMIQAYQQKALFHIVNDTTLRATVNLPEHALANIEAEQEADLELQGVGQNNHISAQVTRVSTVVDATSGTFRVVLSIPNSEQKLRAGMFTRVNLHYAQKHDVVRIPHHALVNIDQASYVFIANENKAQRLAITTGIRENGWIEVTEGLDTGAALIVTGQNTLRNDALLEVIEL